MIAGGITTPVWVFVLMMGTVWAAIAIIVAALWPGRQPSDPTSYRNPDPDFVPPATGTEAVWASIAAREPGMDLGGYLALAFWGEPTDPDHGIVTVFWNASPGVMVTLARAMRRKTAEIEGSAEGVVNGETRRRVIPAEDPDHGRRAD